jgi:MSHA pilin protein MshC
MVELVTVIVVIGILSGIGAMRFFDNTVFESRSYADQTKSLIRYAQKLAIAQNRTVFVRSQPAGFAVCFSNNCSTASSLAIAPGGSNNGSSATQVFCRNGAYVANWLCEGAPSGMVVTSDSVRNEFGNAGSFSFDGMGRPYNQNGTALTRMKLTFASGANRFAINIEQETGYVYDTTP